MFRYSWFFLLLFPVVTWAENLLPLSNLNSLTPSPEVQVETASPSSSSKSLKLNSANDGELKIGILALNSKDEAVQNWQSLADYLSRNIDHFHFRIVPLDFNEIEAAVAKSKIDFLIANPAFYILIEKKYQARAISTLVRHLKKDRLPTFGGVIFSQSGTDLMSTLKLRQEEIAAVSPYSLGGYLLQKQMLENDYRINLNDRRIAFYNNHREVVKAVLSGEKKIGFVRTGILETTYGGGLLQVLTDQHTAILPLKVSTPAFPEWPFIALKHVSFLQAETVLTRLLDWQYSLPSSPDSSLEQSLSWGIHLDYEPIRNLLQEFKIAPYSELEKPFSLTEWLSQYQRWIWFLVAILIGLILMTSLVQSKRSVRVGHRKQIDSELEKKDELINELQLVNKTLRFQQARFQANEDSAFSGMIIFNLAGSIEYINPYALEFWGKQHATLERLNAYHFFAELEDRDHLHDILAGINDAVESPIFLQEMTPLVVHHNDQLQQVRMQLTGVRRDDQWLLTASFSDLQAQSKMRQFYHKALLMMQVFFDKKQQVVFTFDENYHLQYLNQQAANLFEIDAEYMTEEGELPLHKPANPNLNWVEAFLPKSQRAEFINQFRELQRNEAHSQLVQQVLDDQTSRLAGFQLSVFFVKCQVLGEQFYLCIAEEAGSQPNAVLPRRPSVGLLMADEMMEKSQSGMLLLDQDGIIRYVNPAAEDIMQRSAHELIGMDFGIPVGAEEALHHEFDLVTSTGVIGSAELTYSKTLWNGQPTYFVLMDSLSDRQSIQEQLDYHAKHDALTGIANRRLFVDVLDNTIQSCQVHPKPFTVVALQLTNYDEIQQQFGNKASDSLLLALTQRLQTLLRGMDVLARIGNANFAVLLPSVKGADVLQAIVRRWHESMTQPVDWMDQTFLPRLRYGAVFYPNNGKGAIELLKMADFAMRKMQSAEDLEVQVPLYEPNLAQDSEVLFRLESDLDKANIEKEFEIYFQPQFDARTDALISLEALLRWRHPQKGLITPDLFLSELETSGKMLQIGEHIFDIVMRQILFWEDQLEALKISVNLSLVQLTQMDCAIFIESKLFEYGIDPSRLAVEVSESTLSQNPSLIERQLEKIHQLGVDVYLDGFGVNNSRIANLKILPFSQVKIDRSFISRLLEDPRDQVVFKAVVQTVLALGMDVLASGVENESQKQLLLDSGCWRQQGFLYQKPLSVQKMENWFATHRKSV